MNDNPPVRIYVNKTENSITFRINTEYYLHFLTPKIMILFESTKSKITKDKNGEHVPYLEITEVVLVYCNIVNDYQEDSGVLYIFVPNNSFRQLLGISLKMLYF